MKLSADALDVGLVPEAPDVLGAIRDGLAMLPGGVPEIAGHHSASCEAARLGLLIGRLGREYWRLDEAGVSEHDDDAKEPRAADMRQLAEDLDALRGALSWARARSPGGMLAQLAVAAVEVDLNRGSVDDEKAHEGYRRADRCFQSIAGALCAMTGLDRASHGADHLFPATLDRLANLPKEA